MFCKRYHIIFSTFSLKFKCKKEAINNFKNHILVTRPFTNSTHFKKMGRVWKTKSLLFCLRYDLLIVFRRQNHITFIFIKTMSHDLLIQMAYTKVLLKYSKTTKKATQIPEIIYNRQLRLRSNLWLRNFNQHCTHLSVCEISCLVRGKLEKHPPRVPF